MFVGSRQQGRLEHGELHIRLVMLLVTGNI